MIQCQSQCEKEAIYYPVVRIFPRGYANASPLTLMCALPLCDEHTKDFTIENFQTPKFKTDLEDMLFNEKKAAPDFDKSQLTWWPIADFEAGKIPG